METILIKTEEASGDCQKCFYYSSGTDGGHECCSRPTSAHYEEPCFDEEENKYYIFVEQKTN